MVLVPEYGRAVELLGLPEALLDHGLLVLDARRGAVHVEAGELTVPQNVKLKQKFKIIQDSCFEIVGHKIH